MPSEELAGQQSHAPELCRVSGYRRTGCLNWARPDLWGAWLGDHWAYPEADCEQPLSLGVMRFWPEISSL